MEKCGLQMAMQMEYVLKEQIHDCVKEKKKLYVNNNKILYITCLYNYFQIIL